MLQEPPAQLRNHSYLLLTAFMVDTQFTRIGAALQNENCLKRNADAFSSACWKYRAQVEAHLAELNRKGSAKRARKKRGKLDGHLFNPGYVLAFGHTDSLGLVLVDDINSFFAITSELDVASFEHVSLSFCPMLDDLVPKGSRGRKFLREPHELFKDLKVRFEEGNSRVCASELGQGF